MERFAPTLLVVSTFAACSPWAFGAAISPGNLIVYRVGDGKGPALSSFATAVLLDEYTPAGTLVQSIPLPTSGAGALTSVGIASTEGVISRSSDGSTLLFAGYRKDVGGANPSLDTGDITHRVIATLGLSGAPSTGVAMIDPTGTARSAASVDGSSAFYLSTSTGVHYVGTPGAASTSVLIDARNSRQINVSGESLFASNGSTSTTAKVQSYASLYGSLPTTATAATPRVILGLGDGVNSFSLFDMDAGVAGDDTLYLLSTVENLLRKYTFDGTTWTASGSMSASGAANLAGAVSGGNVSLYLTTASSILPFTDTTGYGGTLAGSLGAAIATAGTNTAFRGIGLFVVPEPTSALLGGLATTLLLARRRRRAA